MHKKNNGQGKNTPFYGVVDERTKTVVYQGDAYTGRFMLFAVLLDVFVRSLELDNSFINSNWDLMLIVITGSLISTAYQIKNKVMLNRPLSRSFLFLIALISLSAIIAVILNFFR